MALDNFQLRKFDTKTVTRQEWEAVNRFMQVIMAEATPDDPPESVEDTIRNLTSLPSFIDTHIWGIWNDENGTFVAGGTLNIEHSDTNQHAARFGVYVLPDMRRRGFGTRLLSEIAAVAGRENRSLLLTFAFDSIEASSAFLTRIGAEKGNTMQENQLVIADLDRNLLSLWQARAQERAQGFELGIWEGPYPEAELKAVAAMKQAMNSAPRGSLQVEDMKWTPEQLRQGNESLVKRGVERWTVFVREKATGTIAGYTEMYWDKSNRTVAFQGDTGVLPAYRNLGLGRWLKAATLEKLLHERPYVEFVRTSNAVSNAPMLKINYELGFKPYKSFSLWQVQLASVQAYLAARKEAATV